MAKLHHRIGTLRQLEIVLAVYQHGSITNASKALFLTQPTVSMQLKKLADAVGSPLYDVVGKKLVFTAAGKAVVNSAREALGCFERLDMQLSNLKGLKSGTLRLAVVNTAQYFIPHLLGDFLQQYPNIDIDFKVGNRQQIVDRIASGEDDFYVFSHPPKNWELQLHEFLSNPLVAIAPENHRFAREKNITLKQFTQEPFLIREDGSGTRFAIEKHFEKHEIKPNVRMTISSNEAIKHSVMSGLGVAILSSHTLAFGEDVGLAKIDVKDTPIMTKWYLANLQSKALSPLALTFLDYVASEGRTSLERHL